MDFTHMYKDDERTNMSGKEILAVMFVEEPRHFAGFMLHNQIDNKTEYIIPDDYKDKLD